MSSSLRLRWGSAVSSGGARRGWPDFGARSRRRGPARRRGQGGWRRRGAGPSAGQRGARGIEAARRTVRPAPRFQAGFGAVVPEPRQRGVAERAAGEIAIERDERAGERAGGDLQRRGEEALAQGATAGGERHHLAVRDGEDLVEARLGLLVGCSRIARGYSAASARRREGPTWARSPDACSTDTASHDCLDHRPRGDPAGADYLPLC